MNLGSADPRPRVALAFSGGLDTRWCIPKLLDSGYEIVTVTVDVTGDGQADATAFAELSKQLGAIDHVHIDASNAYYADTLRLLIAGNVLRGGTYPLCVGAERNLQAQEVARVAVAKGCEAVAHGCTAAGNDQVRFEITLRSVASELNVIAPVRDLAPSRAEQIEDLEKLGYPVPEKAQYSVNAGLWGVTIGGKETTGTAESIPESQWLWTRNAFDHPMPSRLIKIGFRDGTPVALDGDELEPVICITELNTLGGSYGIGRGIHLGETILGIKGRVAFEAPAATILIAAHRELEKLVLTKRQIQAKDAVSAMYGDWIHEGLACDPACRDIESLLTSSQQRVTGEVAVRLRTGSFMVEGVQSPYSLHAASRAVYGEAVGEWTPAEALGFSRLFGLSSVLHARAGEKA
ncbi:MAG: argininosuccinate synthase [Chthonomonas sp.]|nr:argininosuccinate synthase [Chthonomonas sp.]